MLYRILSKKLGGIEDVDWDRVPRDDTILIGMFRYVFDKEKNFLTFIKISGADFGIVFIIQLKKIA
jgi:hypothetical protein